MQIIHLSQAVGVVLGRAESAVSHPGVVVRISDTGFTVRLPDLKALPGTVGRGSSVTLRIATDLGVHTANTKILNLVKSPHIALLLAPLESHTITQNRQFFRVTAHLPMSCKVIVSSNQDIVGKLDAVALSDDLSAGGVKFRTTLALETGDEVEVSINFQLSHAQTNEIKLTGIVRHVAAIERKPKNASLVGMQFTSTNRHTEDDLMLMMFEVQRRSKTMK